MKVMECPHLEEIRNCTISVTKEDNNFRCNGCSDEKNLWICLSCSTINCGRYVNGHAKEHYERFPDHPLCMSMDDVSLYCYKCDDDINTADYSLNPLKEVWEVVINRHRENKSSSAGPSPSFSIGLDEPRALRPRPAKRSHSREKNENFLENNKHSRKESLKIQKKKAIGLRNLGNTCFMNAVLQSLNNINPFSLYIKRLPALETSDNPQKRPMPHLRNNSFKEINEALMAEELRKILISLNEECHGPSRNAISPESLFHIIWEVVPRFRGYQQQDAHEFLRYMLDRLHVELLLLIPDFSIRDVNIGQKGRASIVTCVFGGVLQSEVKCLNCSVVSKKHDPFLDLSLDIPDQFLPKHFQSKKNRDNETERPACTLLDCLSSFIEVEELAETELYYCNTCKNKQRSTKRFWIRRLPNVLCLHLKRFRWSNYFRTKIDTAVIFPIEGLDMSEFVLNDVRDTRQTGICNLYDLAAVIVHHGSGAGSGHYTAFAIHDGQWFHFDDSCVQPIDTETVAKCKPYIMFYIRREVRLPKFLETNEGR